jgi:hypothetical protein
MSDRSLLRSALRAEGRSPAEKIRCRARNFKSQQKLERKAPCVMVHLRRRRAFGGALKKILFDCAFFASLARRAWILQMRSEP